MWTTVLALALLLNLEPIRVGLVPLMLGRPNPVLQLFACLVGGLATAGGVGLAVLFVFHRSPLGADSATGGKVQIALGAIGLVIAAAMAIKPTPSELEATGSDPAGSDPAGSDPAGSDPARLDRATQRFRAILGKGTSPRWAGVIGVITGLPSGDYLAVLVVIGSSGAAPATQVGALAAFLLVGNAVAIFPLVSYLIAPQRTHAWNARFQAWVRARTRRQFAGFIAVVGVLLILVGLKNL